ncbi:tRNA (adenosine(37)-N6)-dimethylallyltransferase MiaA [Salipiger sp. IMCC34102]|uniref:tRNA (adenosine(37)-N6)-dimethylallyltransferase MiaA n=1 Tax=Salipiger sp. IMCC34102 TaxID=2510647 RepID=UPI001A92A802|nr:tRNA (adenosine(37)-N6)-dimethylallyltransferase MiaA [Salipiger sp. IMCC34102]
MSSEPIPIPADRPVLIAGPTASGKSALALAIAEAQGGVIVNADALQVFDGWRILTARPTPADEARAPHVLYGHVPFDAPYSVGHWLRDLRPVLAGARPIIVGGTGLYLSALTEGLAEIPPTPAAIRAGGDALSIADLRAGLDPATAGRIDLANRARVQRAWEVQAATGKGLAQWQDETPPPLLPLPEVTALRVDAPKDWLTPRIAARFDAMLDNGALEEARAMHPHWSPDHPSSKAIGAAELIAHLDGRMPLHAARDAAIVATRQYAKRQRTWFRKRMADWHAVDASSSDPSAALRFVSTRRD